MLLGSYFSDSDDPTCQ
uniref:Uncharacterized protein n=1 Tax=Arundo donax TaxID=35708 RepID=A0A0A8ZA94_ARUDO